MYRLQSRVALPLKRQDHLRWRTTARFSRCYPRQPGIGCWHRPHWKSVAGQRSLCAGNQSAVTPNRDVGLYSAYGVAAQCVNEITLWIGGDVIRAREGRRNRPRAGNGCPADMVAQQRTSGGIERICESVRREDINGGARVSASDGKRRIRQSVKSCTGLVDAKSSNLLGGCRSPR
jgi:hypothetical protein